MDFASILSSEIKKKRATTPPAASDAPPKKYLKRSEIEAQRQAAYQESQRALAAARAAREAEKRASEALAAQKREEAKATQERLAAERRQREEAARGPVEKHDSADAEPAGEAEMSDEAAIAKLRELGHPARLFGESVVGRVKRCKRLVAAYEASLDPLDAPPPLVDEEEMKLDPGMVASQPELVYRQLDAWFRLVLREWRRALDERPVAVKESFQGKKAEDAMRQAGEYMKPLFRHFKQRDLRPNVYEKVCEIVVEAQKRRYVKANDVYLKLSIGNAYVLLPYSVFRKRWLIKV